MTEHPKPYYSCLIPAGNGDPEPLVFLISTLEQRDHPAGRIMRDAVNIGHMGPCFDLNKRGYWFAPRQQNNDLPEFMETCDDHVTIATTHDIWHFYNGK